MKTRYQISFLAFSAAAVWFFSVSSFAQATSKIKGGDKLNYSITDYSAKGREFSLEAERPLITSLSDQDAFYTLSGEQSISTYQRKGHVLVTRETPPNPKVEIPPQRQFNWMPPQGDFSKPWAVNFEIIHPQCGTGKMSHEASAKQVKYTLQIGGKAVEVSAFDVIFKGKWDFNNQCRSGQQMERIVYSPELDFVIERETHNFDARGLFNRGNLVKLKAVN